MQIPAKLLQRLLILIIIGAGGFALGRASVNWLGQPAAALSGAACQQLRQNDFTANQYQFINPLLGCDVSAKKDLTEFTSLKKSINDLINQKMGVKDIDQASVYFDTRDGRWLGINPDEKYFPGSLMKLSAMLAYFKAAESHPEILEKKLTYPGAPGDFDFNSLEFAKPKDAVKAGQSYTVDELIQRMIVYSDNNAMIMLHDAVGDAVINDIYGDLGITLPTIVNQNLTDYLSVKSYVNFFRVLYNASYLSREMSERALAILSKTDFSPGLRAGVPPGIVVASKFGEQGLQNVIELHECGIIYYPEQPYMLCVMTKGHDYKKLENTIKDVSALTYQSIKNGI